jgi:Cu(I)/Ag(I) efflux system periplasmic protein CusF
MKSIQALLIAVTLTTSIATVNAASHAAAPAVSTAKQEMTKSNLPLTAAEVRKIDLENKKITLRHGEIKNLDMPGMTMVFQVKDVAMLETVKAGDKVMFTVDKLDGAFVVMSMEKAK